MTKSTDLEALSLYDGVRKLYFIATVRTSGGKLLWGLVEGGRMNLSSYGRIAQESLAMLNNIHDAVCAEKYVVMPNHVHILFSIARSGLLYVPTNDELKHFICDIAEDYKAKTTAAIMEFIASSSALGIPQESSASLWRDGCHVRGLHSMHDYEQAIEHIRHNAESWRNDRYYVQLATKHR